MSSSCHRGRDFCTCLSPPPPPFPPSPRFPNSSPVPWCVRGDPAIASYRSVPQEAAPIAAFPPLRKRGRGGGELHPPLSPPSTQTSQQRGFKQLRPKKAEPAASRHDSMPTDSPAKLPWRCPVPRRARVWPRPLSLGRGGGGGW